MTSVRKAAKTTVTLIILLIGIVVLTNYCETKAGDFFYKIERLMDSKNQIGALHSFIISFSFMLLLIAAVIDSVFRDKVALSVLGSFSLVITISVCVAVCAIYMKLSRESYVWFWLLYYIGLIVCSRMAYGRVSGITGAGPAKIALLLKSTPSKNDSSASIIDRTVIYALQIVMIFDQYTLIIGAAVYCIQNKHIFGL